MYVYVVEGLALDALDEIPTETRKAALRAINKITPKARTASASAIRKHANLPARYLSGAEGRLKIQRPATQADLSSTIVGRRRATSLARYAKGGSYKNGVRVSVKPGGARYIKRSFLMPLRSGTTDGGNVGLAVRTDGSAPKGALKPKKINDNLYLLYGLSVDVLFRRVIPEVSPKISDELETEFLRLLDLGAL